MLKESLGMLEVKGLVAAVTVADTMAKAANVHIRQKTYAKGHGWTTILVTGDVGSVNAALSAGKSVAAEFNWMVSAKVIARPANMLDLALEADINEISAKENTVKNTHPADISSKSEIIKPSESEEINSDTKSEEEADKKEAEVKETEVKEAEAEKVEDKKTEVKKTEVKKNEVKKADAKTAAKSKRNTKKK